MPRLVMDSHQLGPLFEQHSRDVVGEALGHGSIDNEHVRDASGGHGLIDGRIGCGRKDERKVQISEIAMEGEGPRSG